MLRGLSAPGPLAQNGVSDPRGYRARRRACNHAVRMARIRAITDGGDVRCPGLVGPVLSAVAPLNKFESMRGVDELSRFHDAECDDAALKKALASRVGWNVFAAA